MFLAGYSWFSQPLTTGESLQCGRKSDQKSIFQFRGISRAFDISTDLLDTMTNSKMSLNISLVSYAMKSLPPNIFELIPRHSILEKLSAQLA